MRATTESGTQALSPRPATTTCAFCSAPMPLSSPHVHVRGASIRIYCSAQCREVALAPPRRVANDVAPPARHSGAAGKLLVIGLGIANLSPAERPQLGDLDPGISRETAVAAAAPAEAPPPEPAEPIGPRVPTEAERAEAMFAAASEDTWLHPLPAPRRMPLRGSRAFGASRPVDAFPAECRRGHCGIDIGQRWGVPVFAVHDGIVEFVRRRDHPNGGMFVRLSHREGTIFTQYFHLAAIPSAVRKGAEVSAGDVIGLVGDTGIKVSGPHLHFTISVQPRPDGPELYLDPEPLVALWPVKEGETIIGTAPPGLPASPRGMRHRHSHRDRSSSSSEDPAPSIDAGAPGVARADSVSLDAGP